MQEFTCIRKCFWESLIEEGDIIKVEKDSDIPFSVRPFFDCKNKVDSSKEEIKENEVDKIDVLREEFESLGIPYDRRWGKTKLENSLQLAKRDK